jgi:hypothetical protein
MLNDYELLRRVGEALYGDYWQSILARNLGISRRTMQRWAAGLNPVTPSIWSGLDELLARRTAPITELRGLLEGRKLGWWSVGSL